MLRRLPLGWCISALLAGIAVGVWLDTPQSMCSAQARPALAREQYAAALMAVADEIGARIAAAQHKSIAMRLPRRAHRQWADSIPWLLASGALLLCFWLFLATRSFRLTVAIFATLLVGLIACTTFAVVAVGACRNAEERAGPRDLRPQQPPN